MLLNALKTTTSENKHTCDNLYAYAGLPPTTAKAYALFDVDAAEGGLFYDGRELSNLIGRPTAKITDLLPAYLPTLSSST